MISSVLCPFLPAPEGVHIPGFNQLLLLFLGMQFSTGSECLCSVEILPFTVHVAQIAAPSLKCPSKRVLCCLAPACMVSMGQPAQGSCEQPRHLQVGQGKQVLVFKVFVWVCV